MKRILLPVVSVLLANLLMPGILSAQTVKQVKLTKFDLQSSAQISATGAELSVAGYRSPVFWFPVKVPTTVLGGLVANHIYPDPYQGLNNMLIPDASDQFNKEYNLEQYSFLPNDPNPWKRPYWYRTTFKIPAGDKGRHFQLIFKGINYRAAVWVNGKQIADSTQMAGMFADYNLDVTSAIIPGSENGLDVKIYPLDYPGYPSKEQLQAVNIQDPRSFSYLTSSSYTDSAFGGPNVPRIRGQYADVFYNGMRSSFTSTGYGAPLSFNSIETINITKGPASVIAGPGPGVGGSADFITKRPEMSEFAGEGEFFVEPGNAYGQWHQDWRERDEFQSASDEAGQ